MIVFYPPQAEAREHKIGKTVFTVNAYYCGFESIYNRLAYLMQSELEESQNITLETGENTVDIEQD